MIERCAEHGVYPLAPAIPATVSPESKMKVLWRTWLQGFGLDDEAWFLSRTWSAIGLPQSCTRSSSKCIRGLHWPRRRIMLESGDPRRPRAMSAGATALGAQICSTAQQAGVTGAALLRRRDTTGFGLRSRACLRSHHRRVARVRSATLNPLARLLVGSEGDYEEF